MGRPLWKGAINFGLVSVAIQLETAVRDKAVRFHMLSKDGSCRLRQKLYCPETGKEYDFSETARGIEVAPGQYVLIEKRETEKIVPERGRVIEIEQFVDVSEIDPIYFDAAYFAMPTEESVKVYRLLVEALRESKRVGLARFVMREREHLAALRVLEKGLVLHTLHFADEVSSIEDALPHAAGRASTSPRELQMAKQLVEQMTGPLDLKAFKDTYREQLEAIIEQKKRGRKTVEVSDDEDVEPAPRSMNLMDALKKSLEAKKPAKSHATFGHRKSA